VSLSARSVRARLGGRAVLHGVDLDAAAGEVTAIVGPNGSGKSTLLRALTGELAAEGEVALNGRTVRSRRGWELAAMRAVLPQAAALAFPFTVAEVVRLGQRAGLSAADPTVVRRALARVDLTGYAGRLYQELSGGEQSRAQLARVLAQVWEPVRDGTPSWLFLDEPVASLDIGHQLSTMEVARDFARRGGGVVAVMHDLNLTALFADRVVLMAEGRVLAAGPVREVLTDALLSEAYRCALRVNVAPAPGGTFLLPHAAGAS
jgi:iron complex transport system ATP-binding protein